LILLTGKDGYNGQNGPAEKSCINDHKPFCIRHTKSGCVLVFPARWSINIGERAPFFGRSLDRLYYAVLKETKKGKNK